MSMIVLAVLLLINAIQFRGLRSAERGLDAMRSTSILGARRGTSLDRRARAIIFLFPLLWSAVASVSGQPGTAQAIG